MKKARKNASKASSDAVLTAVTKSNCDNKNDKAPQTQTDSGIDDCHTENEKSINNRDENDENNTKDTRSRKWQITINNPTEKGFSHDRIKEELNGMKSLVYWCMADEEGKNETYHTHIYVVFSNAVRFSTMKNRFDSAHLEMCNGTSQQNRDYVFKEGKHEKERKKITHHTETHEEYGQMPIERQGARNDLADLQDMIEQGMTNAEIVRICPQFSFAITKIEQMRQTFREEQYKNMFRQLDVTYVYGKAGVGKTRDVMEKYGYPNVYRFTDYQNPFDNYGGQDIVVFEEFRSSLKIQDMLNYLDGYPLQLPCRYANKVACYTKVYIITNIELEKQYESIQLEHPETWNAFKRRIHKIKVYSDTGISEYTDVENYLLHQVDITSIFPPDEDVKSDSDCTQLDVESTPCPDVTEYLPIM
jgi:hypothetical protein